MSTDDIERLDLASVTPVDGRLAAIREQFPEAISEGKVDFDALRRSLGDWVDPGPERFGLTWPGKAECMRVIQQPSIGTLVPMPEESVDWDTTQNVIIEGENLEVLKLLQKAYYAKVKLIYIDPPYNTGSDFIYPDNFKEGLADYLRYSGQVDDDGLRLTANAETDGRFHSKWLSMMFPRLFLARNLLADDGIVAVQIGDAELAHLRSVMDEIFGVENYVNTISVRTKVAAGASGGGEDRRLKKNVEFVLLYAKELNTADGFARCYTEEPLMSVIAEMRENDQSWKYTSVLKSSGERRKLKTVSDGSGNAIDIYLHEGIERTTIRDLVSATGASEEEIYRQNLDQTFSDTNAQTSIRSRVIDAVGPLQANQMYSVEYRPVSGRDKGQTVTHWYISNTVRRVIWLGDIAYVAADGKVMKKERTGTLWDDIKYNNVGKEGGIAFPNGKKPVQLLERIVDLVDDPNALVLDFFAGSGSTAHAVSSLNNKDCGSRVFILVQLPEPCDDESFQTIACMTRERVRRSIASASTGQAQLGAPALDVGFRSYRLEASNFGVWDPETASAEGISTQLSLAVDNVDPAATQQSVLTELLLKAGFPLAAKVAAVDFAGLPGFSVENNALLVCLSDALTIDAFEAMVELEPAMILVLDAGFGGSDELKVNALQTVRARNQQSGGDIALRVV